VGVTQVTWSNDRGGSGTCSGTTAWRASGIRLYSGSNVLTVTARDGAGNPRSDTLTVAYTPPTTLPDYTVTELYSWPNPISAGDQVTYKFRFANQGGPPQHCIYQAVFLSSDATITTSDTRLRDWDYYYCNLAAGDNDVVQWVATIPANTPPGSYYIGIMVDVFLNEAESNENNNTLAIPITIESGSTPCSTRTEAGEDTPETHTFSMGQTSGTFDFFYDTYIQEDRITVSYEGSVLFDTGCVGASATRSLKYAGSSSQITVSVSPNCAGGSGTAWEFTVFCPE
jgi:hypothetical protein